MSDSIADKAMFAFLASCVGNFVRWPQCSHVSLRGDQGGGRLSESFFKVMAINPVDRTVFRIVVTKDREWRVRVTQISNHVLLDESVVDQDTIVNAVNLFAELAGMRERENRD